jgi:hypothetical protein
MNLVETNIPDITKTNLDKTKLELSERIVKNVYPLLNEFYNEEMNRVKTLESDLKKKSILIQKSKEELENRMIVYNRKKKLKKLIDRISRLVSTGLAYDSNLRNEMVVLLKVAENLSEEKLDYHLKETLKVMSKRFVTNQ